MVKERNIILHKNIKTGMNTVYWANGEAEDREGGRKNINGPKARPYVDLSECNGMARARPISQFLFLRQNYL